MTNFRDIEGVHGDLKSKRQKEEGAWTEISRSLEEDGGDGFDVRTSDTRGTPSFDSTSLYAKDDFVGSLFTEAMNPAEPWMTVSIEDADLKKWGPVAKWLYIYTTKIASSLDPANSNFYIEATPQLGDMAGYGTGFIGQEENIGTGAIIDRALPIREMFKDVDADGLTSRLHREFMLTGMQAKMKFGDLARDFRDNENILFVHALYRNPDFDPGRMGARFMPWKSCYVSPDKQNFGREGFYNELPIHEIEWQRKSGRVWARGPGHKARADMGMLDEVARSTLTAVQFAAEPMMLVHDEDVLTAADIQPNAIIPSGMNGQGKRNVEVLDRGEQLNIPLQVHEKVKAAVREGFKFSIMQIVNRPQMTASEFLGWKEERLRILAPHLVSIHRGLGSFIKRRAGILWRRGDIPPPPPEMNGHALKVEFVSPFVQAQKASKARAKMQLGQSAIALRELDPNAADNLNADNIMRGIADGLTGDPDDVRDPREVQAIREGRMAAQQQDLELARGAQQAGIIADVAHAGKAMSTTGKGGAA